jgi:NAD-dependent SIR2 family protein deacetylase
MITDMSLDQELERAADALKSADALLVCAGAGMGVGSGLPDFRGDEGFWNAYPPYRNLGVDFMDMANPQWFRKDANFAWGFYGHRRNLYRKTIPHAGFATLLRWGQERGQGYFAFTSNVDGQFQKAGFDPERIVECHGAIDWNQCMKRCGAEIFKAGPETIEIDETTMRAADPLPACPECGGLARPNILMFGDFGWDPNREADQMLRMRQWLDAIDGATMAVVECGAGTAIPSVRSFARNVADTEGTLIRVNPREPQVPVQHVGLAMGAVNALERLDAMLSA